MPQEDLSNFDEVIDRANTGSIKWDPAFLKEHFGKEDLLPLWVADMDFRVPQPVIDALVKRAQHGIFGYTFPDPVKYNEAVKNWFKRRFNWSLDEKWFVFSPGIVPACTYLIQRFTQPGDKVIIQNPVYYPFIQLIENNGRKVAYSQLELVDSHYKMDLEDLEKQVKDSRTRVLILCSPHNPVGRVWSKKELTEVGDICLAHNILVISDEIHCDLVYPQYTHTV
ncbi:MAG: MalY/PatB family protein, partial [Candidatus Hodarchaeales archaeon]